MTTQHQLADHQAKPLLFRVVTFLALFLVLIGSTAQATHIHGDWFPHPDAHAAALSPAAATSASDANCPLCLAMHSAFAAQCSVDEVQVVTISQRSPLVRCHAIASELHFTLFSRPPPAHAS